MKVNGKLVSGKIMGKGAKVPRPKTIKKPKGKGKGKK